MANDKRPTKGERNSKSSLPDITFLRVNLDKNDKEWLAAANCAVEFPPDVLFALVATGFKFSLSYDPKNASFIATLTDKVPSSPTFNCCISARGSSPTNAWYSLAYRHFHKLQEDWSGLDYSGGDGPQGDFG